jgi:TetR/AcrR family transcriptional regulator, cholesterol catabolism regulator
VPATTKSAGQAKPSLRRQNREAQLIEAATEIFSRRGYAAASIQEVADAVGMLKGSLYHYIGSKEELLYAIFDEAHREAETLMAATSSMDAAATDKLRFYTKNLVLNALGSLDRTSLYFRDWRHLTGDKLDALVMQRKQYESFARGLVNDVFKEAGIEPTVKPKYVSFFVLGGINWLADWYRPGGNDSAASVADGFAELVLGTLSGATPFAFGFPATSD